MSIRRPLTKKKPSTLVSVLLVIGAAVLVALLVWTLLPALSGQVEAPDSPSQAPSETASGGDGTGDEETGEAGEAQLAPGTDDEAPVPNSYALVGPARLSTEFASMSPGEIRYCELDELERAGCAYAQLTSTLRATAQQRGRLDLDTDPAGWPAKNFETEVHDPFSDTVYRGWLWNRSHLLADSLGGSVEAENLVTGTRTQNVGIENGGGGGMARAEEVARDYLDTGAGDACPLSYSAVPSYRGDELVPRSVTVDLRSCDGSIDERIRVQNVAYGFDIDYADASTVRVD